ncbi:hypothetical protein [Curtobacterium sp. ER1/6]|uniref:hypothetical protein n=1 Tax=Curtobacterium sp. ER1/6 TaxID=1891920 RepID=UPI00084FB166|nr:hypothetical protein [Curtobacterium sp. ER1/6]OEI68757.1 hypothetical protein Cus16_1865 [Curtobacterium sp. ER1/6]
MHLYPSCSSADARPDSGVPSAPVVAAPMLAGPVSRAVTPTGGMTSGGHDRVLRRGRIVGWR